MKKLAFLFVAVMAISFASCGNNTEANTEAADSDTVVAQDTTDTTAVDSTVADTTTATAE